MDGNIRTLYFSFFFFSGIAALTLALTRTRTSPFISSPSHYGVQRLPSTTMENPIIKPKTTFLDLPPEMRNAIYKLSVDSSQPATIDIQALASLRRLPRREVEFKVAFSMRRSVPSLLFASRQIMSEMHQMCIHKALMQFHEEHDLQQAMDLCAGAPAMAPYLDLIRNVEFNGSSWPSKQSRVAPEPVIATINILTAVFPCMEKLTLSLDDATMSSVPTIERCIWKVDTTHLQEVQVRNPRREYCQLLVDKHLNADWHRVVRHHVPLGGLTELLWPRFKRVDITSHYWNQQNAIDRLSRINELLPRILKAKREGKDRAEFEGSTEDEDPMDESA